MRCSADGLVEPILNDYFLSKCAGCPVGVGLGEEQVMWLCHEAKAPCEEAGPEHQPPGSHALLQSPQCGKIGRLLLQSSCPAVYWLRITAVT